LTVEDFSGSSEVLVFPEAWTMLADRVKTDVPVLLKGSYSRRDQDVENPTFIVESLTPFVEMRLTGQGGGFDRRGSEWIGGGRRRRGDDADAGRDAGRARRHRHTRDVACVVTGVGGAVE
jgi:hypothetical protein